MRFGRKPLSAVRSIRKQFVDTACQGSIANGLIRMYMPGVRSPSPMVLLVKAEAICLDRRPLKRLLSGGYLGMGDRTDRTLANFDGMAKWNRKKSIRAGWRQRY